MEKQKVYKKITSKDNAARIIRALNHLGFKGKVKYIQEDMAKVYGEILKAVEADFPSMTPVSGELDKYHNYAVQLCVNSLKNN